MTPTQGGTPVQIKLDDLFARYLQHQLTARTSGFTSEESTGEVVPHEAGPVQPVDPRLAWDGAIAVLALFQQGNPLKVPQKPADWTMLATIHEPAAGLAFAAGNFPQLVRNLQPLLQAQDLSSLRPGKAPAMHNPSVIEWATQTAAAKPYPQPLLALGVLRLARQFDAAAKLLADLKANVPAAWQAALANEEAALAWHAGRADEAVRLWKAQPDSVPVLFNRGMAALFTGRAADACAALSQAVSQLPEDSAWHHLGRLYLALAETQN